MSVFILSLLVFCLSCFFDFIFFFFFSSRRRHTRSKRDWSSDVCSSDLLQFVIGSFASVAFGTVTSACANVLTFVLRNDISSTVPSTLGVVIQSFIVYGFSVIIITPPNKFA